jgi:predicted HTH domain antitoxin
MQITIDIPDDLAYHLVNDQSNLERTMLELCVIEAYRNARISAGKARELLGFSTQLELDAFFKAKGVDLQYDKAALEQDLNTLNTFEQRRSKQR